MRRPGRFGLLGAALIGLLALAAPAAAVRITVEPNPARIAPSSSQHFTADVILDDGRIVSTSRIRWTASPALGRMRPDGTLTASATAREGLVTAAAEIDGRLVVGHAFVRIVATPQTAARALVVLPRHARLGSGEAVSFDARLVDGSLAENVEWRVIPDALGTIDVSGHFTAGTTAGEGRVVALSRSDAGVRIGQARVFVRATDGRDSTPSAAAHLTLLPRRLVLQPGESSTLHIEKDVPAGAKIDWRVEPPSLATVTADGTVTAGNDPGDGIVRVRVQMNGRSATGAVALRVARGNMATALRITPHDVTLTGTTSQAFTVRSRGRELPPNMHVEWRVVPDELGRITPTGIFTPAALSGSGRIVADVRDRTGSLIGTVSTHVTLAASSSTAPFDFSIVPGVLDLSRNESRYVTAEGTGSRPAGATIEWSVIPSTLLTIDQPRTVSTSVRARGPGTGVLRAVVTIAGRSIEKTIPVVVH